MAEIRERARLYAAIEELRKRPLIVYATSTRHNVNAQMAADTVREFIDQMDRIQPSVTEVDVLLHSSGGDALAAWKLISVLRERFKRVHVLVPFMAFSAATIFALGADEIVLHPHASLGPIDPQIAIQLPDGKQRNFAFEDVGAFLRFLRDEVGITEQVHVAGIADKLFSVVDPINVGAAKRASELSTDVGERLLRMHMTSAEDKSHARAIAENLNKSFFAHGDAVSRARAKELDLKVAKSNIELETAMWKAFLGIEAFMDLREPFEPLQHFLANGGAASIAPTAPVVFPPNMPPQLAQQAWTGIAQQAVNTATTNTGVEVPFDLVAAVVESSRLSAVYHIEGTLSASRLVSGQVNVVPLQRAQGWRRAEVSDEAGAKVAKETGEAS